MNRIFTLVMVLSAYLGHGQLLEDSLKAELIHRHSDSTKVLIYQKLAWEAKYSEPRDAFSYLDTARILALEVDSDLMTANVLYYKAIIHYLVDEYEMAITDANNALTLYKSTLNAYGEASIYNLLGLISHRMGDYEATITHHMASLQLAQRDTNKYAISNPLHNIALVYIDLKQYTKALEYEIQAYDIRKEIGDSSYIAQSLETMGVINYHLKKYFDAEGYLKKAQRIVKGFDDTNSLSINYSNLGLLYRDTKRYEEAISNFELAIINCKKVENHEGLVNALNNFSGLYFDLNQYAKAEILAEEAVLLSKEYSLLPNLEESLISQLDALEGQGELDEAFRIAKELITVSDSLLTKEKTNQIANIEIKYQVSQKEQQIALQSAEISKQKAQNERNLILIMALAISVGLLVIILLLARSKSRKKQQLLLQEAETHLREAQIKSAITSQENERSRFARDLHDGFGQMISILNLNLKSLREDKADKQEVFDKSADILEEMYQELKGVCFNLMPQTLIKHGVKPALQEFAARINASNKILVETSFFGLEERLSDLQEISIYRITQEWVNNVIKYSDAKRVVIQITMDDEEITLLVEDDGTGFDKSQLLAGSGNGWKNMNSRTNLISGELELDTTKGVQGSTLILNAPVRVVRSKNLEKV